MLYTEEVWDAGHIAGPRRLVGMMVVTFGLLLAYNRYAGMRPKAAWWEVAVDSVEELGLALLLCPIVLFLLDRIGPDSGWNTALGTVVVASMTVAIGVSVGTAQLGTSDRTGMEAAPEGKRDPVGQTVLAVCGAVLVAANIAPTDEVVKIALEASPGRLLGLTALSILVGSITLFHSGFVGSERHVRRDSRLDLAFGVMNSYGVSLLVSMSLLWFFGRFDGVSTPTVAALTVVLALPTVLGASAGRLLVQGGRSKS